MATGVPNQRRQRQSSGQPAPSPKALLPATEDVSPLDGISVPTTFPTSSGKFWRSYVCQVHRRDKTVPEARDCLNKLRTARLVTERGPNLAHARIQPALEIHHRIVAPDGPAQLLPRDQLSWTAGQHGEHFKGLRRELDHDALLPQQVVSGIELEPSEVQVLAVSVLHGTAFRPFYILFIVLLSLSH